MADLDRLIREAECRKITGLSRSTRWRMERRGQFPPRVNLTPYIVGWRLSEVMKWVESRVSLVVLEKSGK